jgi:hypothetical protein
VQAACFTLKFFTQSVNIFVFGEVDRANVGMRAERLRLLRDCFEKFLAAGS